jgi:hypothetical protein
VFHLSPERRGHRWLYEHLYDLVTWFGGAVILESRYLASLIEDIIEADFTFSFDEI